MALPDDRNILKFGPPKYPGQTEITPAMVESVRQRIKEAGQTSGYCGRLEAASPYSLGVRRD